MIVNDLSQLARPYGKDFKVGSAPYPMKYHELKYHFRSEVRSGHSYVAFRKLRDFEYWISGA